MGEGLQQSLAIIGNVEAGLGALPGEQGIYTTVAVLNVEGSKSHTCRGMCSDPISGRRTHVPLPALVLCPDKRRDTEQRPGGIPSNGPDQSAACSSIGTLFQVFTSGTFYSMASIKCLTRPIALPRAPMPKRRFAPIGAIQFGPAHRRGFGASTVRTSQRGGSKLFRTADDAVADVKSGSTILSSGFGLCGVAGTNSCPTLEVLLC